MIAQLAGAGLTKAGRVVVEKPFGHDLQSARALAQEIHKYIDESQLYRIDHFLGKMGTDELLYLRFGNTTVESIWNRSHIACMQITMAEAFGVEDRGHFYDPVGALRDVVVNHLMQVLAVAAMEAPAGSDAETLKDAKFAVFRATETADAAHYVRGQYDGYLDIEGVAKDSTTETYAALRLKIDNWRWAGVPWFIRTGKRLPVTQTELRAVFRHPPRLGFMKDGHRRPEPNQLVVKLDPATGTRLVLAAHRADRGQEITLDMEFAEEGGEAPTPYEVLLLDAMRGDSQRFTRQDSVEETWRVMQPLIDSPPPVHPYAPGTWGPQEAERLVAGYGAWHGPWVVVVMTPEQRQAKSQGKSENAPQGAPAPQSAAAPSPFPPIAEYAFLSNCHTGALVAPDGAIDWLCVPRFDSPSVFGTLLDRQAGAFRLGPFGINVPAARVYEPGTNTLLTTWTTPTGWAAVRDSLTLGPRRHEDLVTPHTRPPTDEDAEHMLVRVAVCLDGEVEIELTCEPVFDYGRVPPEWSISQDGHRADATGAGLTLRLQSDMAVGVEGDWVRARHVLKQGEQVFCALSWAEELHAPEDIDDANARLATTGCYWRDWLGHARMPDHRWREPIQRSALAIKGLTYMPTGATVAALTTSLPETPGGERNWDYRYTWLRDSTFTLQALHYLNLDWEAEEFMQFVADLQRDEDGALQIMYGIDGRRDLTESTRDDLSGYAGARPVRVGNGAFDQRQNDVYGAALDSILLHVRRSERLPRRLWPIIQAQAAVCEQRLARPRPGHLGGARQAAAVRLLEADVLGGDGPRRATRGDPRRQRAAGNVGRHRRRDQAGRARARRGQARRAAPALRNRRARRLQFAGRDLRLPARRRRAPARQRAGDRRRADRGRLRAALPHRRDRRRHVRQGGQLPDLLLLAGLGAGGHRRGAACP